MPLAPHSSCLLICCNVKGKNTSQLGCCSATAASLLWRGHGSLGCCHRSSPAPPAAGEGSSSAPGVNGNLGFVASEVIHDPLRSILTGSLTLSRRLASRNPRQGIRCLWLSKPCISCCRQMLHLLLLKQTRHLTQAQVCLQTLCSSNLELTQQFRAQDKHRSILGIPSDQVILEQTQCPQQHHCRPVLLSPMLESPGKGKLTSLQKFFQPLFTEQTLPEPALPARIPPPEALPQQETHAHTKKQLRPSHPSKQRM